MKKIFIIILLLTSITSYSQIRYNDYDSTFVFTYQEMLKIRDKIEVNREEIHNLELTIEVLNEIGEEKDKIIYKMNIRDSLYSQELKLYKDMDVLLREKLSKNDEVISNYKALLFNAEDKLNLERARKEEEIRWKNIYKYGYPAAIVLVGLLLLK